MSRLAALGARLIRATTVVDRAYRRYDQVRALLVTGFASDSLLAAYNDLTYAATDVYDASTVKFRDKLFNWEAEMVERAFPPPPARVLIGGAGGGREAFQLAARGYEVTAFEPSPALARSMADRVAQSGAAVQALLGRYEEMPLLRRIGSGEPVDLARLQPFDAAMLGWSSFSHIRDSRRRSETLRAFAGVTHGPVVVSFFFRRPPAQPRSHRLRRLLSSLGRRSEGDSFTTNIGFYHLSSPEELATEIEAAGLSLVEASYDESDGHWPWVSVARPQIAVRLAAPAPVSP